MAQYLPLPDGSFVTIREGESPEQAWARAQQMYPEAFGAKQEVKKAEPTVGGQVKEFFKGLAPGAIGLVESAAIGASALLPEETEKAARETIAGVAGAAKKPFEAAPGYEDTVGRKFGQAVGSIAPFLALGPAGLAGRVGMGALGAGAGAGEARTRAEQEGGMEQRGTATALGAVVGISEMFAPARILGRIATPAKAGAVEFVKRALVAGGEEAAQEAAAQAAQNMIAKGLYKPEQEIIEQVGESAAYGGATGALVQGLLDLAIGRRAKGAAPAQSEIQQLHAEEEQRRAAAAAEKATPDYARRVTAQFADLTQQRRELVAQQKELPKNDPQRRVFGMQINNLSKQIKALEKELPQAQQTLERARVEGLSPEEAFLERQGITLPTAQEAAAGVREEDFIPQGPAAPAEEGPSPAMQYAQERIALAQDQLPAPQASDYVAYLQQDPALAAQLTEQRGRIPGLSRQESDAVIGALRLQAKEQEKTREGEFRDVMAQREALLKAPTLPETEQRYEGVTEFARESKAIADQDLRQLDELAATALAGTPQAEPAPEGLQPSRNAPRVRETVTKLLNDYDQTQEDYANAMRNGRPDVAKVAYDRGTALLDQINAMAGEVPTGELTKGLKAGPVQAQPETTYAKELIAARRAQAEALDRAEDALDRLRREEVLGKEKMAAATAGVLAKRAEDARAAYVRAALREAAVTRRAEDLPALTTDEAVKAASQISDVFSEWMTRVQAAPRRESLQDVVVQPAVMRADKIIRGAKTRKMDLRPLEERRFGAYNRAVEVLKDQLEQAKAELAQPKRTFRADRPLLKTQFAETEARKVAEARGETAQTLEGELRRRREYTLERLDRALQLPDLPEGGVYQGEVNGQPYFYRTEDMRELLEKAREAIDTGRASRDLLDAVDAQVSRLLRGEDRGDMLVSKRAIAGRERVVGNVPGKEGSTRFGERRTYKDVAELEQRAPLSEYQQDIKTALAAAAPTALEQKAAGQKQLFPETEADLGYIRMTPKAFANSPRMREVWEALGKARAAAQKKASKETTVKMRNKAAAVTLQRLTAEVERLKADTKFFWSNTSRWTDAALAKAYAGYPDIGNTPEENVLVDRYLKGTDADRAAFLPEERAKVEKLFAEFRQTKMPQYEARRREAEQLLAQGERLDDMDNQLLRTMQDANKNVAATAANQRKEVAVLQKAIEQIKSLARSERTSPLEKKVTELQNKADAARSKYNERVEQLYQAAYKRMDDTLAEILDPDIKATTEALEKAKERLEKESAELERVKARVDEILSQPEGRDRMQLATYQQFKYEEKKSILRDMKKQVVAQMRDLQNLMETRFEAHDTAAAALEAVTDKKVQAYRDRVTMLEEQLAGLRGEPVTATKREGKLPSLKYPFAAQKYEAQLKAAQESLKGVKRQQAEAKEIIKSQAQQMEEFWKGKLGGSGIKRQAGRVEPLVTAEQQRLEKLREEERERMDQAYAAEQRQLVKDKQLESIDTEVAGLIEELGAYEDFPNELAELKALAENEALPQSERDAALAKAGIIQNITSLEAQRDTLLEGKPAAVRKAATAPSSLAMAKQKPLRTGYTKSLFEASEALRSEREGEYTGTGVYGGPITPASLNLSFDLRNDSFTSDMAVEAAEILYKGAPWYNHKGAVSNAVFEVSFAYEREKSFERALKRAIEYQKTSLRLYKDKAPDLYEDAVANLAVLQKMQASEFTEATAAPAQPVRPPVSAKKTDLPTTRADFVSEAVSDSLDVKFVPDAPFHGMTFAEAAKYGAKRTTSPQVRMMFEKLAEVFEAAPVKDGAGRVYAVDGLINNRALGIYNNKHDVVYNIAPGIRGSATKVLLHELTHAATVRALDMNKDLNESVSVLRERVIQWLETKEGKGYFRNHAYELARTRAEIYGLKNNREFVAELFANRGFQKLLTQVPSPVPRKSIFTRFVETLSKFFAMPAQAAQSTFAEAIALTEEILAYTKSDIYGSTKPLQEFKEAQIAYEEPKYNTPALERAGKFADQFIAKERTWLGKLKANLTGLAFETQVVDRFAGFERLAKYMESLRGTQMMYYLRMYDQRMNFTAQAVARGAPQIVEKRRADGRVERVVEAQDGPSIKGTVDILKEATPIVGNAAAVNRLFTMYMSAIRAKNKGLTTLNFKGEITQEALNEAMAAVGNTPGLKAIFDRARAEYNAYNRDLIKFLASTGAISDKTAEALVKDDDYIPWYRKQNGVVDLVIGSESPIRIGDVKSKPYLDELVGGDKPILDFMTSSVQNTNMIVDMGLNNLATKNAVFELININAAKIVKGRPDGPDVVRFKEDGVDKYAVLATEKVKIGNKEFDTGIPADIVVKGMEGIPTQMPFLMRAMAMPAQLLRKAVTLSPLYMARQLFRDSLAAPILSGADFTPVAGALRQFRSEAKPTLEKRGITGGQQFVGRPEDLSMILRDITADRPGWMSTLGKFEAASMEADALTRRAQYNSYVEQGMSEMEATLMALESMNFNKRGASPSIHAANALIPFFNAQIQGLNVLYRAMFGKMPFNDQLKIRQKMLQRGGLMAAASFAYAMMMEDDEAYKNATPDQKYGNWFIRIPGLDEPVRLPVPFEIGYIFKALPEAIYNSLSSQKGAEDAADALKTILRQTIPGGSSYGIPQAMKPLIEVGLGKSFYTGRDILSAREKELLPQEQFRVNTAEISKALGKEFGISPVKMEALISGYTGTMGLAFLHALSIGVPKSEGPEQAVKRMSEYPLIGGAFQPNDAGGIINNVYERFNEAIKIKNSVKEMFRTGRQNEAKALMDQYASEMVAAEFGEKFKNNMQKITAAERAIQASNLSPQEKREQLDRMRRLKIAMAETSRQLYDQTVTYKSSL